MSYDSHVFFIKCRGADCNFHNRCDECKDWEEYKMQSYVKYRRVLASKSKPDKKGKVDELNVYGKAYGDSRVVFWSLVIVLLYHRVN